MEDVRRFGRTPAYAAKNNQMSEGAVRDTLKRYRRTGSALPVKRGKKAKNEVDAAAAACIIKHVDTNRDTSIAAIHKAVELSGDLVLDPATIQRWVRQNARISLTAVSAFSPPSLESEDSVRDVDAQEAIDAADCKIQQNCIFFEESGYIVEFNRTYTEKFRTPKELPLHSPDICVFLAVSYTQKIASDIHYLMGRASVAVFYEFVDRILATFKNKPKHYLFFPSCLRNVADKLAKRIEEAGHCAVFLPREQNPAFLALDWVKMTCSRKVLDLANYEAIDGRLETALSLLQDTDIAHFVNSVFCKSE